MRPIPFENQSSLKTRASLLFRLRNWEDGASWENFYRLYYKLVYGLARRAGLTHDEAEDVTQDVFKRVAETIRTFESDPRRGSFRGWLMNLTRWRIADKFRDRPTEVFRAAPRWDSPGSDRTGTMERLPDPEADDAQIWEAEWQRNVLSTALTRLARRVPAKHFQAFDLYTRQQWPVRQIARELGINPATVYLIGHRLTKQLKAEVTRLKMQLG
jgi:RNA polymerase sigma factor (sigma-70 family)